jgi:hypothetical protein
MRASFAGRSGPVCARRTQPALRVLPATAIGQLYWDAKTKIGEVPGSNPGAPI